MSNLNRTQLYSASQALTTPISTTVDDAHHSPEASVFMSQRFCFDCQVLCTSAQLDEHGLCSDCAPTPAELLASRGFAKTPDGFRIKANRVVQRFDHAREALTALFSASESAGFIEGAVYHPRSRYASVNAFYAVHYTHAPILSAYTGLTGVPVGNYPHLGRESDLLRFVS